MHKAIFILFLLLSITFNDIVWIFASSENAKISDKKAALDLAEKGGKKQDSNNDLTSIALVYAVNGQKDKAKKIFNKIDSKFHKNYRYLKAKAIIE